MCCLVETWQTEDCTTLEIPGDSRHSVCTPFGHFGPIRGGICVYAAAHLSQHVKVWRVAADSSYVWLCLSHMKVSGSEVHLCVWHLPAQQSMHAIVPMTHFRSLQNIVDAQNAGGCIVVYCDMNARMAEQDDYTRLADLQDFVNVPDTWLLMFPKGATVTKLPLLALGEMSCWSYVGLLNYRLSMDGHLEISQGDMPSPALREKVWWMTSLCLHSICHQWLT